MVASPNPYAEFSVSSGCLCFGALNNIWNGASLPVQPFPKPAPPRTFGTVRTQPTEFNIAARNGTWNAFQLIDLETKEVAAWFVAHSDVDPNTEIDKILLVSGSPYEPDSGSHYNDEKTAQKGVFVINRYEWGYYYDQRSRDEVLVAEEQEREAGTLVNPVFESAGLVDLTAARSLVLRWKEQRSSERECSERGAWLHIPGGEYMFGRFGFDDERVAACSFLFFTTHTCFTRTAFKGMEQTLRKAETPEERFERRLREGCDFSGLEELRQHTRPSDDGVVYPMSPPPPPPLADCLGPYERSDHILRIQDIINAIRAHRNARERRLGHTLTPYHADTPITEVVEPWAEPVYDVINEMFLSYLQRTVIPRMGNQRLSAAAELLFTRRTPIWGRESLDTLCSRRFTASEAVTIPNFDSTYVSGRIAAFLSRFGDASITFEDECVAGITRVVAFLLAEVIELADTHGMGCSRDKIMPVDVRMVVQIDDELRDCLHFSKVYWEGRSPE